MSFAPPEPKGARELNIGDQWRSLYALADEVPEGLPINYAYITVFAGDRGYVIRKRGDKQWLTLETRVGVEQPLEDAVREEVRNTAGIEIGTVVMTGYLDSRATQFNKEYEQGIRAARAVVVAVAANVEEQAEDAPYERRRLRLNEYAQHIRDQHRELARPLSDAIDRYMVMRARGEA